MSPAFFTITATRVAGSPPAHGIASALLVAPADPDKFGIAPLLPAHRLDIDSVLIASETELTEAVAEALTYLDRCLDSGFRPGMGNVIPDRLFWAQPEEDEEEDAQESSFEISPNDTRH